MTSLLLLAQIGQRWGTRNENTAMLDRMRSLPRAEAIDEFHERDLAGLTALHHALWWNASLEMVATISAIMEDDASGRGNIFALSTAVDTTPLHLCAIASSSVPVLQLVIDKYPNALLMKNNAGMTPLFYAQCISHRPNRAAIARCIEDNTARYLAYRNQSTVKLCLMEMKRQGATEYVATAHINQLSPPQFVFMVLDHMKNCAMEPLAEDLIAFVGTNVGLSTGAVEGGGGRTLRRREYR